jgi:hypothetical protein
MTITRQVYEWTDFVDSDNEDSIAISKHMASIALLRASRKHVVELGVMKYEILEDDDPRQVERPAWAEGLGMCYASAEVVEVS